ncbi:DUF1292 domain-containing protein [Alkalihalobacterium elongatum]|uniref:DUF1292 domain-containing protein n=1 Tax=Alkalihalobacterium elongatum TaxID=2675466 RepID=UPI001C1FD0BC|nr:DUF1292 domain-containing protein [Alkalihalobacterium elongatum]
MTQEERERIIIPDENGDEHLFEELFKFTVDETGKNYILLVPVGDSEDEDLEDDMQEVIAFQYEDKEGDDGSDLALMPIETDEEWAMVEEMLNTFVEEQDDEE